MNLTKLDTRFFESTRGQIVMLLRSSARTVNEIAERLGLTDNAIRAHLLTLERDGLVEQKGAVKGFRKPHYAYGLTDEARHLFPKPYAYLFNRLLDVLKSTLPRTRLTSTFRTLGHEMAGEAASRSDANLDTRLEETLKTLEALGGAARIEKENGNIMIKSQSCPFSEAVAEHPETCQIAEAMIEEMVGRPVKEVCNREGSPKCCFEVEVA